MSRDLKGSLKTHINSEVLRFIRRLRRINHTNRRNQNCFSTCSSHSQDTYLLRKDFYSTVSLDRQTLYWTESLWIATLAYCTTPQGEFPDAVKDIEHIKHGPTNLYGSGPKKQFPTIKEIPTRPTQLARIHVFIHPTSSVNQSKPWP